MVKKKANICLKNPIEKTLQFIHSQFTQRAQIPLIIKPYSRDGAEPHRRNLIKIEYVLPSSKHPSNLAKGPPDGGLFAARRRFGIKETGKSEIRGCKFQENSVKYKSLHYIRPWRSWISQWIPIPKAGGSNPSGRANEKACANPQVCACLFV